MAPTRTRVALAVSVSGTVAKGQSLPVTTRWTVRLPKRGRTGAGSGTFLARAYVLVPSKHRVRVSLSLVIGLRLRLVTAEPLAKLRTPHSRESNFPST